MRWSLVGSVVLLLLPGVGTPTADAAPGNGQRSTCGLDALARTGVPTACWRPFSDGSFLNRPLPARPRQAAGSRRIVRELMSAGEGDVRGLFPVTRPGEDYYVPFVFSGADDPTYRVRCDQPCGQVDGAVVRIPCGARAASGTDAHLAVIDRQVGVEWDFLGVTADLRRCAGGRLDVRYGSRAPLDGDGGEACANAACVALTGGIIRFQELAAGRIDHALAMVVGSCSGTPVYPAVVQDSCPGGTGRGPAMGQWFRLALSRGQIARIKGIRPWQRTILRTLARHGGFVSDRGSNGGFELETESPATYAAIGRPNPWRAWAERQVRRGDDHVAVGGDSVVLGVADGLSRGFWRENLRAVDPCVIRRAC